MFDDALGPNWVSEDAVLVIVRRDPDIDTMNAPVASDVQTLLARGTMAKGAFALTATVTSATYVFNDIVDRLRTSVEFGPCEKKTDAAAFEVDWALAFYDAHGKLITTIYLSDDGQCAQTRSGVYSITPFLIEYLHRQLNFMNFF